MYEYVLLEMNSEVGARSECSADGAGGSALQLAAAADQALYNMTRQTEEELEIRSPVWDFQERAGNLYVTDPPTDGAGWTEPTEKRYRLRSCFTEPEQV